MTKIKFCDIIWAHLADYAKEINNGGDKMYTIEELETPKMQERYKAAISNLCSQLDLVMPILNTAFQQISPNNPIVLTDGLTIGDYTYRIDGMGGFTVERTVARGSGGNDIRMSATKASYSKDIFFGEFEFGYSDMSIGTGMSEEGIEATVYFERVCGELTELKIVSAEGKVKQLVSPQPHQRW